MKIPLRRLDPALPVPEPAHPGDAGVDLYARVTVTLAPGERALVPTGVAVAIPDGHVGLVSPRSGLAIRNGISIVNTPGLVDSGYRGELQVIAVNLGDEPVTFQRGDRIAQLVVLPFVTPVFDVVAELPGSVRGADGFGSTGGFASSS
jgi:dUTP pyrophosphatase